MTVDLELEGGVLELVEINLPCLITVQTGIHRPRYPSLSNVMRARSMEILTINSDSLIKPDYNDEIESIDYPPVSSKGVVIEGTGEEKADRLLDLLHEKGLL
jgi:electron transfer flavoprotein beta subunit